VQKLFTLKKFLGLYQTVDKNNVGLVSNFANAKFELSCSTGFWPVSCLELRKGQEEQSLC